MVNVHYAAGILPITWKDGKPLFLVGKDIRDGTWSDFGGKVERFDRNDYIATACREFYEETYGCVTGIREIRSRIRPETTILLKSSTQNGHPYYMLLVEIAYVPHLRNAFHKALNFIKSRNIHRLYIEKTDVSWVTPDMLLTMPKRSVFANTVMRHREFFDAISSTTPSEWRAMCKVFSQVSLPSASMTPSA